MGTFEEKIVIKYLADTKQAEAAIQRLNKAVHTNRGAFRNAAGQYQKTSAIMDSGLAASYQNINKQIERQQRQFPMWSLSFLFAGMMIRRTMDMIFKTSIKTFMKITRGSTEAGKGITRLAVHWEFLKFSVGEAIAVALLPYMDTIIGIIDGIANFVQEHPNFTTALLFGIAILGILLFTIGQVSTFVFGLKMAFGLLGPASTGMATAVTGATAGMAIAVIAIIAALAIFIYIEWDKLSEAGEGLWTGLSAAWENDLTTAELGFKKFGVNLLAAVIDFMLWAVKWSSSIPLYIIKGAIWGIEMLIKGILIIMGIFASALGFDPTPFEDAVDKVDAGADWLQKKLTKGAERVQQPFDMVRDEIGKLTDEFNNTVDIEIYDSKMQTLREGLEDGTISTQDGIKMWQEYSNELAENTTPATQTQSDTVLESNIRANQAADDIMNISIPAETAHTDSLNKEAAAYERRNSARDEADRAQKSENEINRRLRAVGITPSYQFGGEIPQTGLAMVHKGERVVTSTNKFEGGINVTVNTSGGADGNSIARQIMDEISRYTKTSSGFR